MSTTLRIDSFQDINIVERGVLTTGVEADSTTLELVSTDGFAADQIIYVGHLSREGVEKATIESVDDEMTLTTSSGLKLAHGSSEPVTAVLGDRIKIYRAANVDGTAPAAGDFTMLTTRTIDADQPSTYYRDEDGSSAYWYSWSYFNATTTDETDRSEPIRGQDWDHYASLAAIRKEAGFQNAHNLADSFVEEARRQAQSDINTALAARFTTPFNPVPEQIRTLTIRLAAAILKWNAYGDAASKDMIKAVKGELDALANGDGSVTGDDGSDLDATEAVSGYLNRPGFRSVLEVRMEHDESEVLGGDA